MLAQSLVDIPSSSALNTGYAYPYGNTLRRGIKKKHRAKYKQRFQSVYVSPGTLTLRSSFISGCTSREASTFPSKYKLMKLHSSSIENNAYPFQNHGGKPLEEEVTQNKSNECLVSGQLDETQDLLFEEFNNLSETQTKGVRHKAGLGTDDSKSDTAQFGVEGRALEGFKCCADVVGRVGEWVEGRNGAKSKVFQGFKRADDEIRAFKGFTSSRTETGIRNFDVLMDVARDKGSINERFRNQIGIESRVLQERVLEKDVDVFKHCLLHNLQWFETEGMVFESFKDMDGLQGGILERGNGERKATVISEFQQQNLMKDRTECGVLGELSSGTKSELRIYNAKRNGSRSYADAIAMHMVRSSVKIEENLSGGKDMPTSMGSLQDKKNMEGRILQAESLDCDRIELHQSVRENFNKEINTEGHRYPPKQSQKSILVKSSSTSGCRNVTKKMETKRKSSHKSYGGCIPAILQALDSTDNIDEALAPWEANLSAKERSIILKEQWDWERAVQIFKWFQKKECYEVNVIHYNILLRILGRAQKWDQLKKFWEKLVKDKVLPTITTYGTLIDVYGKAGLKEEALLWLDRMISQGLWPDEVIVNTVVHILKKAREFEKAEQFFRDWSSGKIFLGNTTNVCSSKSEPDRQQQKNFFYISRREVKIHFEDPVGKRGCSPNNFPGVLKIKGLLDDKCMDPYRENDQVQRPHSSYMYNTLIDTYGKAGRLKEASKLFSEMLIEGISPNVVTFNTMIHICGSYGYLDEADALMVKMEELHCLPDTRTYNTLIALHAQNDNIDKAFCYFTKMKEAGLVPDTVGCRTILYAFCIRHMVSEVEAVVREMGALDIHVDEYSQSAVIRMYIDLGMLKKAWAWFERFHLAGGMSCECYAANIDAYGEKGYWLEAENVFKCSQERGEGQTVLEFNVMIKAYGIAKVHDKVLKLFERMEVQGVLPDRCTYASVIQTLASSGLLDESNYFITKMQEAGFVPNCSSFCAVIAAYGRLGRAAEAEKMFENMIKAGVEPDVVVYGALINAFAEAGCVEEAVRYFQIMQDAGFAGNSVVYSSLIKGYSKRGLLKEAQETYKRIQKLGVDPDAFLSGCMLDLYTRADMVTEAQEVFKVLKEKQQANEFSFAMMLSLYKKNGRLNEATEIAKEMLQSGFLTNILSFNSVISLFIADGRLREAAEVFHQMLKLKVSPNETTYKTLGILLKKGGIPREAVEQLDVARKSGLAHGIQALRMTIYSVVGMHAEALEACDELRASGLDLDVSSYNAVIYAFGSAGRINEAYKMFISMQAKGLEPDTITYASMIISYGKLGLVDGVRRMFYKMKQKGFQPNEFTFKVVIDVYKSAGKFALARVVTHEREFMHQLQEHGRII